MGRRGVRRDGGVVAVAESGGEVWMQEVVGGSSTGQASMDQIPIVAEIVAEAGESEERRRATEATGNGKRAQPRLGVNIAEALRRDEVFGRSWRGSREGG